MKRTLAAIVLSLPLGCGDAPVASERPAASPTPTFLPGHVYRYAFSWSNESEGEGLAIMPSELRVTGGLDLSGVFEVRAFGPDDAGDLLAVSIASLDRAELRVFDQNVLSDPSLLVGATAYVELPGDGALRRVYVEPDAAPIAREILTGLLGRIDLRTASAGEGAVAMSQGLASARYEADGSTIRRELLEAIRTDADVGTTDSLRVHGEGSLVLDPSGEVRRLENLDALEIVSERERPVLEASTRFEAERVAVVDEGVSPRPDLERLRSLDLWDPPDDEEARRELGKRFADGLTSFDAAMTIGAAGAGLPLQRGFAVRAVGMLRGWPERAGDMLEIYGESTDDRSRLLVFDLLASAGTEEAQWVMLELADDARDTDLFPDLVQRFAFLTRPIPEIAPFLLEAEASARSFGQTEARRALLYPMGSLARRLEQAPAVAEALLASARDVLAEPESAEDAVAALGSLGNAGMPSDYGLIEQYTRDEDPAVRGMAAVALRKYTSPAAVDRLFEVLADPDRYVARQAIRVLDEQSPADYGARLATLTETGAFNESVALAIGNAIRSDAESRDEPGGSKTW